MRALFADLPEACDNTLAIAQLLRGDGGEPQAAAADLPESASRRYRGRDRAAMAEEGLEARLDALGGAGRRAGALSQAAGVSS
jgi:DNA polymerase-3 subunit alpha